MKIAIITTDNRQHDRNYAALVPYFGTAPEALLQGFAGMPELEVHVVSCTQKPMKSPEKLADNIWFHSLYVPKIGWMRTSYQGCIRAVRRKLKVIQPDIVHGQGTERECAVSAVFSKFPNVLTIHGNMAELARLFQAPMGSFGWLAAQLENITLKRTRGVFCNSEYTESLVKPRTPRTWRVPNAIRAPFCEAAKTPSPAGKCVLINVGLISERKRQLELLDVARRLHAEGLDFELQFVGQTPEKNPYAATFMERLKEAGAYARHLGVKSTEELIGCFDAAHGLLHFPSEEAFGLVVAEGMARDVKFFGARLGGIIDISSGVPDAELFEAEDWDGLTGGIANWVRNGHPRSSGGANIMKARYHPAVVARRHVEI
ncbi:MAG TPA: glycosyltransferase family 4 protein, partial [Verrucomicrobiae bacterium]|nr:glycosyltransferase family 4 protein [Verrucomicrobiae bacterium]